MSKARGLADLGNAYSDGALSNRNLIINGAMQVAQRGTQTNQTGGYTACDRWQFAENGSSVITTTQDTNVPVGQGFGSSLKIDVTNASGTPAASNYALLRTKFEGQNLQQLVKGTSEAKDITLSFWVRSPKTGIHVVELFDSDNTRSISKSYTISSANTWQKVSVLYAGDTTGSLDNDNADSMQLIFWLMAGSNNSSGTLAEVWQPYNAADRAVGQVNVMDNASNDFYLTGVQLEVGDTATPFEHRSYGDELARCQRYYWKLATGVGLGSARKSDTESRVRFDFPTQMRASPTVTFSHSGSAGSGGDNEVSHVHSFELSHVGDSNNSWSLNAATADAEL